MHGYSATKKMRIIFLDMDGVLNRANEGLVCQDLVDNFKNILSMVDVKVVLASTWRQNPQAIQFIKTNICDIIDCTPIIQIEGFDDTQLRGLCISAWLKAHPETKRYAIIDDSAWVFDNQLANFFRTNGHIGLTKEIAEKVVKHFEE